MKKIYFAIKQSVLVILRVDLLRGMGAGARAGAGDEGGAVRSGGGGGVSVRYTEYKCDRFGDVPVIYLPIVLINWIFVLC